MSALDRQRASRASLAPRRDRGETGAGAGNDPARTGSALIDPQTLMRIKSLQMRARVAVEGFIKGIHRSPYHGFSVEFSEYREYTPGDDPRYLDWKLYARSDRYYVKRFEDETNLRCYLVLDSSRSMGYRSAAMAYSKSEYARTVAATIAHFLTTQRDAVGLLTFEDRITQYLPPRYRPGHLRRLLAALEHEPQGRATNLAEPLEQIAATVHKRGLIVVISDLLAPTDALKTRLGYLRSRGHDVIVLRILDPAEVQFGFTAPAMFHDVESGRELYVDPEAAREEYLGRFAAHAAEIARACVDLDIEFKPITTDRPMELVLFDLLKARMRRGRRPGRQRSGTRRRAMSFLTPLYALGFLAIAAPIVFHLIRRTPRGEVPFSSLMFLSPSPPRLTRRSRLDHLLLLLLRATALCLLALAFTRPFWRQAAQLSSGDVERRRVAVVIDTSASMRRGDLWTRARALAEEAIAACRPADQLAVFAFDVSARPLLSFAESATLDPARRQAVARARVAQLTPGWGATHLGQSLIDAVAAIEDVADTSEKAGRMPRRVVLISDLQQGSRLETLGNFEWPSDVELDLKTVSDTGSNAGLHGLAELVEAEASEADPRLRVRVSNDTGTRDRFELIWVDANGSTDAAIKPLNVYVPPGESRVVRVPRPTGAAPHRLLRLKGDAQAFDNTLFLVDAGKEEATVVYVGNDRPDDPAGLLYYLERVFHDTPQRSVRIRTLAPSEPLAWQSEPESESKAKPERAPSLVIVSAELAPENVRRLQDYVRGGGTVLGVVATPGRAETLAGLAGTPAWDAEEATVASDVMLGEVAFDHPLFAPLAGAQFNDFTKIHFWKYRRIKPDAIGAARVLARFENGDPAVIEKPLEKGRLIVLTSGWNPADSQLARSSKFVPLISGLLEVWNPRPFDAANHLVGDRVTLPAGVDARAAQGPVIHKPDGTVVRLARGSTTFSETDQPGLYTIDSATDPTAVARSFVVNLDPLESKTSPLHVETLEQFGCRLTNNSEARKLADQEQLRQMQNAELENRQKFWRWLILATIGVLIVETWLAGRVRQPRLALVEAQAT